MPLAAFPVLSGLVMNSANKVSPRRVERIGRLSSTSKIASAAYQQYLHAVERKPDWPEEEVAAPATVNALLAPDTAAALQTLHSTDAHALVRVMVAAAKADGAVDDLERRRMFAYLHEIDGSPDDRAYLLAELEAPHGLDGIAEEVETPEQAIELYTAALITVDLDTERERTFMAGLAAKLKLDPQRVAELHAGFDEPPPVDDPAEGPADDAAA